MTIGSILFGIAILIILVLLIGRPLLIPKIAQVKQQSERLALLYEKGALLETIQTLDFDHETGKMPEDVYESQRTHLVKETAAVMKELETAVSSNNSSPDSSAQLDAKIEAAIARQRARVRVGTVAQTAPVDKQTSTAIHFCPQCGTAVDADDIFCSTCGHKLTD